MTINDAKAGFDKARQFWVGMDRQKQKLVLFVLAIGVVILYLMSPSTGSRKRYPRMLPGRTTRPGALRPRPQTQQFVAAPSVAAPAASITAAVPPVGLTSGSGSRMVGFWSGMGALPPMRGFCTMNLEIRDSGLNADSAFAGYATLGCTPTYANIGKKPGPNSIIESMGRMNPAASILAGGMRDDSLVFRVKQTVGESFGCRMSSATLTPFGTGVLALTWTENGAGCGGGNILMQRTQRR